MALFVFVISTPVKAQYNTDRFQLLQDSLDKLSEEVLGLEEYVDLSVNQVNIADFLRGVSKSNAVNITVDPNLDLKVTLAFTKLKLKDLLIFLCKTYDLDLQIIGNILVFKKYDII